MRVPMYLWDGARTLKTHHACFCTPCLLPSRESVRVCIFPPFYPYARVRTRNPKYILRRTVLPETSAGITK
eukprot:4616794-Pyramimonas_sp.AAC.1